MVHWGKTFHESVYQGTLQQIIGQRAISEFTITVFHGSFVKDRYIDLLVDAACPFELKAAAKITDDHVSQLIQYLMLLDVRHGKLINFGGEKVEHQFVNCNESHEDRRKFGVHRHCWSNSHESACLEKTVVALVKDWGTGLSRSLYEEACIHFFGGKEQCWQFAETSWGGRKT